MSTPLTALKGVGPGRQKALHDAGIRTLRDLLLFLPREYRDLTSFKPLAELRAGDTAAVRVRVFGEVNERRAGKLLITRVYVTDDTATIAAVWYNQPWLKQSLRHGRELTLYGKCEIRRGYLQLSSPTIEQQEGLIPVYRAIPGVPQKVFRELVENALRLEPIEETLPVSLVEAYRLMPRERAIKNAHFPESREALEAARRRIAFEELLLYQVAVGTASGSHRNASGVSMRFDRDAVSAYWQSLPFPPTKAQARVLNEIAEDMLAPRPMARLVQGDVGCGKTAIAFGAIYLAHQAGYQSAMMAPTEVLAQQHYQSALAALAPLGLRVGYLSGSLTEKAHRSAHEALASGAWDVVIGTHALISEKVRFQRLGLVITDEQHRFGVRQRSMLGEKGSEPNVLVMSATPIPRTLSLILYGDLDISVVDELPPGRQPVRTRIVPPNKREDMYAFLLSEIRSGRQVYVICPLVEESEAVDALPAEQVYEDLRTGPLSAARVALVHGRMKARDKDNVLEAFHRGETDVLVSTTVIEVGVNVPNATVMVIENAERFGLAQLHQLRGRVGRGSHESWCFLMAEPNERLRTLTQTNDGFLIAQKDMELRGPGELFGVRQSGPASVGLSAAGNGSELLELTHNSAKRILAHRGQPDAEAVIQLAKETYADRLTEIRAN